MNRQLIKSLEELICIVSEEKCLIYCAGRVAKNIVKYLSKNKLSVEGILVTEKQGNSKEILGVPVFEMRKYIEEFSLKDKTIIVCALENIHDEIVQILSEYNIKKIICISDWLYNKVEFEIGDYELEVLQQIMNMRADISANHKWNFKYLKEQTGYIIEKVNSIENAQKQMQKFISRPCIEYFIVNILDHCNLRCIGCDHFACIADPYFVPVEVIKRDVERMAEIMHGDNVIKIAVMGGEPLLHPDLLKILKIVRSNFPYAIIRLTTNGLLLLQQTDLFWQVCREQGITIVNTKYPINLDFDEMKEKAKCEKVRFQYFEYTGDEIIKTSFKKVINLNGDSDPVDSFTKCHASNYCNFLMEGKLYGCPFSCQSSRIFNKKFNQNLRLTENDYLDIYEVNDMQEVLDFAARPKSYCRYCDEVRKGLEWTRSKQEMCEWIDE